MPNYAITWDGVDTSSLRYWTPEGDPIKNINGFKQIKVSFCPDENSKIKFDFRSIRHKYIKFVNNLRFGGSFPDFTPPTISLDDLEHELRERDEDHSNLNPSFDGSINFSASWRTEDEYTQSDNQWY